MTALRNQTFDDRDTGHLIYQGDWFLTGSWNASNVGESGTLSSTSDLNANVTFTFPTPAVAFYYYGIPRCCGGLYGICIDCDPNNRVFLSIDAVNTTDDGKNPPVVLFSMTFKTPGVHEIIIRNQNDTRFGKSQITLDRIDLEVVDDTVTPSITPTPSTATSTDPARTTSPSSSSPPIGAIVGGALGAGALLLFVVIFALWLRLRRKRAALADHSIPPPSNLSPMPPQSLFSPSSSAMSPSMQQTGSTGLPILTPNRPPSARYGYGTGKRQPPQFSSVSTFSEATSTSQVASQPSRLPRRETDGGPLQLDDEDTLPPEYGQVFAGRRVSARTPPSTTGNTSSISTRNTEDGPSRQPDSHSPRRRKF